ncbi:MAG: nicotinate-nucleotide--dimethylbenzimidazole phosphoribosyltransferase [Gemmatimonadota bacterium]
MNERALEDFIASITPPEAAEEKEVRAHLDDLTKPPGSLGRLEELALRLALILGYPPPPLRHRTVFVLAGDHGVTRQGVSAYPAEVTAQMCDNIAAGGAAVSVFARRMNSRVVVADFGVASRPSHPDVLDRNVRRGSGDLSRESAMTREEAVEAVLKGSALVEERSSELHVVGLGEMGIGNTTSASCLCAALTGASVEDVVGPGTGISGPRMERKREVVRSALDRLSQGADPLTVLAEVGGLEIAGLVGVTLGAARVGIPVVTDGFIATAAVMVAVRMAPEARSYVFAGHMSAEPGHAAFLKALGLRPVLSLDMRLGEGTGAVLSFPILDSAGSILREMATFSGAGVVGPVDGSGGGA